MHDICECCGDDDATWHLCSDCLAPKPEGIAADIARCLGGEPSDYAWIAQRIVLSLS